MQKYKQQPIIISYFMRYILQITTLLTLFFLFTPSASQSRSCPASYFFDAQHCQKCQNNCLCTSEFGCDSCVPGYTFFRGACIQCPQASGIYGACSSCCSRTEGTQLSCTDCVTVPGFYSFLFSGRCILSVGCFEVDANGYCLFCRTSYYSKNNLCYSCDQSCKTCADSDNCLTCAPGYYWKTTDYGLCTACPNGCATCNNMQVCSSCLSSYYFYGDHCLQCPLNCQVCIDGSTCTKCSTGILISNLCIQCSDTTFGGSTGCLICYQDNNFVKCSSCAGLYFLDTVNGICRLCADSIPGAAQCKDQKTPTQCLNDYDPILSNRYYLIGISCIQNTKNCKKILDINGNCLSCYPGYTLTSSACVQCPFTGCLPQNSTVLANICTCTACMSGFYLSGGNCLACSTSNCAVCAANVCSACLQGYFFGGGSCQLATVANCVQAKSASPILCAVCSDGYFLGSDELCYMCQQNCLKCTSRFVCTSCVASTTLINGFCQSYPSNCAEAVSAGQTLTCTLCKHGYYLNSGYCIPCQVQIGTLGLCDGLCPIDYYIKGLLVQVGNWQGVVRSWLLGFAVLVVLFFGA